MPRIDDSAAKARYQQMQTEARQGEIEAHSKDDLLTENKKLRQENSHLKYELSHLEALMAEMSEPAPNDSRRL